MSFAKRSTPQSKDSDVADSARKYQGILTAGTARRNGTRCNLNQLTLMKVTGTPLPGLLLLEPKVFGDARGFFLESYNEKNMAEIGIRDRFVQDNQSFSTRNVLRGLHYQVCHPQGKLVRVVTGEIFDVAVDMRRSSSTFGKWHAATLSGENKAMFWIPPGFAHGFRVADGQDDGGADCGPPGGRLAQALGGVQ